MTTRPDSLAAAHVLRHAIEIGPEGVQERIELGIAEEIPLTLIFNEFHVHAVMMVTPLDLHDFVLGFVLTEKIIAAPSDMISCHIERHDEQLTAHIRITGADFSRLIRRGQRLLTGGSSCGLCGVTSLDNIATATPSLPAHSIPVSSIRAALNALPDQQVLNQQVHMVHAAAWASPDGIIHYVREDVGRHNALDKLIGILSQSPRDPGRGFCLLTSRCSYEMVEKALTLGISTLVAVSSPTDRAIQIARKADMTLIGNARRDRFSVFCGGHRLVRPETLEMMTT
ncbi:MULTISPECIES: formate dehydrogenase accessory sulfurtransferase FdhD [Asaia]|uniref:Sulfur carrier protein FdhD n=1 Tax=Asaia bogorensis TaxID=91915 RepID=A0A060QM87_9PROT|nr:MULTISPECIES: formate dehydrogenase accessory sulfurtransferase FdhD [Asaia]MDL2170477.1 formate dehydrogenase accessory sulfurtransferase FdhD [Asaia sp. HumB]CDG41097.1 Formate dehydrogenase chain D [Asaia bogorensis]